MKVLKEYWGRVPYWAKCLLLVALLYKAYKWVSAWYFINKATKDYKGVGATGTDGQPFNAKAAAVTCWHAFYDGWFESEARVIEVLTKCPAVLRREVNKLYAAYLLEKGNNPNDMFSLIKFHYGKSLQEDCEYYMSDSQYSKVKEFFNSL